MAQTIITALPEHRTDRYVYAYAYPNGTPFYVGKGTGSRYLRHLANAKKNTTAKTYVVSTIKGLLTKGVIPVITKIAKDIDDELAYFVEQEYIAKYGRKDIGTGILKNCTAGGDGVVGLPIEKFIKRTTDLINNGLRTRFAKGQSAHNKGVPMTTEQKLFLSKRKSGVKVSIETRQKMSFTQKRIATMKGSVMSQETKNKISMAKKGVSLASPRKPQSAELRARINANMIHWTCPHCRKQGKQQGAANRWHFDNCKEIN